jgi:peroxiredoxin (alkyl hydroperoxide reductase subunit C)
MPASTQPDLLNVDWSLLPKPEDDGAAAHLVGMRVPDVELTATNGNRVSLSRVDGRCVVFAYPRTGRPGDLALVDNWDSIPGARGCTPHACAFRDEHAALIAAGCAHVFGLSTQDTAYQREAAERLHLPFAILSDAEHRLTDALRLPAFVVAGARLIKRLALVIDVGAISKVFYPVFPPDRNAAEVLSWVRSNPRATR